MRQLPIPASSAAREYRALEVMEQVPAGCRGVLVMDDRFAPHLRCGEFAVVDVTDEPPQLGEIYVTKIEKPTAPGGYVWRFAQVVRGFAGDTTGACVAFANRIPGQMHMVDGPYTDSYWATQCLGRVVGVIEFLRSGI